MLSRSNVSFSRSKNVLLLSKLYKELANIESFFLKNLLIELKDFQQQQEHISVLKKHLEDNNFTDDINISFGEKLLIFNDHVTWYTGEKISKDSLLEKIDLINNKYIKPISEKFSQANSEKTALPDELSKISDLSKNDGVSNKNNNDDVITINNVRETFFSNASRDIWQQILSHISFEDRCRFKRISKFFQNQINQHSLPKEGFELVKSKNLLKVINLSILNDQRNQIQDTKNQSNEKQDKCVIS